MTELDKYATGLHDGIHTAEMILNKIYSRMLVSDKDALPKLVKEFRERCKEKRQEVNPK